jgi:hypothetical protein
MVEMKVKVICSFETVVTIYQTMWCCNTQDHRMCFRVYFCNHILISENNFTEIFDLITLKFYISIFSSSLFC